MDLMSKIGMIMVVSGMLLTVLGIIDEIADMVSVVRCSECKKSHIDGKTTHYLWCTEWGRSTDTFGFCERADRKERVMVTIRTDGEVMRLMGKCVDFVSELIDYIAEYPDDDYMTMECLCRKLVKHGLIDKEDGYYLVDKGIKVAEQTERSE